MTVESLGVVNIEKIKQALPQMVEAWRSIHSFQGPDHWETLLTQISRMWWSPLEYTANDFQKIKAPTLILVGDRDQMVPGSDHSLPRMQAGLFSIIVLDFLLRHST
jgi:pimeloyl-ACP methyl ester carboxylesterase